MYLQCTTYESILAWQTLTFVSIGLQQDMQVQRDLNVLSELFGCSSVLQCTVKRL